MNQYLLLALAMLVLACSFLAWRNNSLQKELLYFSSLSKELKNSLDSNKIDFKNKLEALETKQKNDATIKQNLKNKKDKCYDDSKALEIIAIGVPECLQ